ncbi:unnamed protein product [Ambrosiozyma monospora]|uniref:Unnamed protein product n=1 Tax=Ambrosiozyma monospora TaxID=43982 RepID=A0A9W7DFJ5_AMBMO|nr:unnamed protein product [Ambrosiozyma monospora]
MSLSDTSLKHLLFTTKRASISRVFINRAASFNSTGIFTSFAQLAPFNLKLIYSTDSGEISSRQYNVLRTILGSRVIKEKFSDASMGAILKTNVYDYRVLNKEKFDGFKVRLLGVASDSIELKLKKKSEDDATGELYGRGFNLGKLASTDSVDDEYWMKLDVHGKFGNDGCFYQYIYD